MNRPYKYTYKEYKDKFKNLQNKIDIANGQELISLKNELDILESDFAKDYNLVNSAMKQRGISLKNIVENEKLLNEFEENHKEFCNDLNYIESFKSENNLSGKDLANYRAENNIKNRVHKDFIQYNNQVDFIGGGEEMTRREETKEYNQEFFNYMRGRSFNNAMTTVSTGGAVIPTTTFNGVIDNIRKQTGIISKVRILNIPGKMTIPQSQIIEGATWHDEGTEIGDTTKEPKSISLSGYELAKLFSMSIATQSMSIAEFEQYLTIELGNAMSSTLNDAILHGTGEKQPTGIIQGTTWNGTNSKQYSDTTVFTDLVQGMILLGSNFRQNACWYLSSTTLYKILSKVDTNGNPIFTQGTSESPAMKLLGKEIVIDDYIEDDVILLGDASYYFLNFSNPVTITRSEEAGFTKASILYRAISVVDGKLVAPSFIKFTKSA